MFSTVKSKIGTSVWLLGTRLYLACLLCTTLFVQMGALQNTVV